MKKHHKVGLGLIIVGTAIMVMGAIAGIEGPAFLVGIALIVAGTLVGDWWLG